MYMTEGDDFKNMRMREYCWAWVLHTVWTRNTQPTGNK